MDINPFDGLSVPSNHKEFDVEATITVKAFCDYLIEAYGESSLIKAMGRRECIWVINPDKYGEAMLIPGNEKISLEIFSNKDLSPEDLFNEQNRTENI